MLSAADAQAQAAALRSRSPEAILAWGVETFGTRLALTVSFGGPGVALAHMLHRLDERIPIVFLDTGMLFRETYEFKERFARRYGLNVVTVQPLHDPGPLYETDPDACCTIRKVEPMQRTLAQFDAWASAVRRDQGASRAHTDVVEHHVVDGRPLVKIHPLAHWTRAQVTEYLRANDIPHHPLLDLGYASLGCRPCTRATIAGEGERAGRWPGLAKTECGLHTFTSLSDSGHES